MKIIFQIFTEQGSKIFWGSNFNKIGFSNNAKSGFPTVEKMGFPLLQNRVSNSYQIKVFHFCTKGKKLKG